MAALALLAPTAGAAGTGEIAGTGTATTFQNYGGGVAISGVGSEWNEACVDCLLRITIASGPFVLVQGGSNVSLDPGTYELREFTGLFSFTQVAPHDFAISVAGSAGHVVRVA